LYVRHYIDKFNHYAEPSLPQATFQNVLGRMLLGFNEINQEQFDLVGEVQARTVVIAQAFDDKPDLQSKIIEKFPDRRDQKRFDLNGVMFKYASPQDVIAELDQFIGDLAIDDIEERKAQALSAVKAEKGVHPNAAAMNVLIKAFLLTKDEGKVVSNAALTMQMATRALARLEAFQRGEFDRESAHALQKTVNKLNYTWDPKPLVKANEILDQVCSAEKRIHTTFLENPDTDIQYVRRKYEMQIEDDMLDLLKVIPQAAAMFREAGRENLAKKAEEVFLFYNKIFEGLHLIQKPKLDNTDNPDLALS
jgi:hypothetical protein